MESLSQGEIQPTALKGWGVLFYHTFLTSATPILGAQMSLGNGEADGAVPRDSRGVPGSGTLLVTGLLFPHRCLFTSLELPTARTLSPLVMLCQA